MVKESYKQGTEYEMVKRIMNFIKAKNNPTKKIGANKTSGIRKDYVPAPTPKSVQRFEQLNKQDASGKTEYEEGRISITVKDSADTFDVVLPGISEE